MKTRSARAVVRLMFANPVSAVYLGAVAAAMLVAVVDPLAGDSADASMIWVWPALLTMPSSGVLVGLGEALFGGDAPGWYLVGGIVVSALAQSLVLGAVWRSLRGRSGPALTKPAR